MIYLTVLTSCVNWMCIKVAQGLHPYGRKPPSKTVSYRHLMQGFIFEPENGEYLQPRRQYFYLFSGLEITFSGPNSLSSDVISLDIKYETVQAIFLSINFATIAMNHLQNMLRFLKILQCNNT